MTVTAPQTTSEPVFFEQTWDLSYRHALGETVGSFLQGVKDKKLLGRRCPVCTRVLFPARSFCDRDHVATEEYVEVGHTGVLEMFTIVYEAFPGMRVAPPYVLAYALLDGADTAVVGYVKGMDLSDVAAASGRLTVGTPLVVRFEDEPEGAVTDFWFELAGSGEGTAGAAPDLG
jgi:uncharacterized OB-fold protein